MKQTDSETIRKVQLYLLRTFYRTEYAAENEVDFYKEFDSRLIKAKTLL